MVTTMQLLQVARDLFDRGEVAASYRVMDEACDDGCKHVGLTAARRHVRILGVARSDAQLRRWVQLFRRSAARLMDGRWKEWQVADPDWRNTAPDWRIASAYVGASYGQAYGWIHG